MNKKERKKDEDKLNKEEGKYEKREVANWTTNLLTG